eukprot:1381591-Prymnesium_polylepis.2
MKLVSFSRRAERVCGVEVRIKEERRLQRICFVHGLHNAMKSLGDVPDEPPIRSFANQLRQAK